MENKNQPAFPVSEETTDRIDTGTTIYSGLSKREYIAAMAMQGLIAQSNTSRPASEFAKHAVIAADALLEQLKNQL